MKEKLLEYKKQIDPLLEEFLKAKLELAHTTKKYSPSIIKAITEFTLNGGKRVRPALMYCFTNLLH